MTCVRAQWPSSRLHFQSSRPTKKLGGSRWFMPYKIKKKTLPDQKKTIWRKWFWMKSQVSINYKTRYQVKWRRHPQKWDKWFVYRTKEKVEMSKMDACQKQPKEGLKLPRKKQDHMILFYTMNRIFYRLALTKTTILMNAWRCRKR